MRGFVYVLVCEAMPGLAKVGMTTRGPWERAQELSASSGLPAPFVVHRAYPVVDAVTAETLCHETLRAFRYADNREFFQTSLMTITAFIEVVIEQHDLADRALCLDRRETVAALDATRAELERLQSIFAADEGTKEARIENHEVEIRELRAQIERLSAEKRQVQPTLDAMAKALDEKDKIYANLLAHYQLQQKWLKPTNAPDQDQHAHSTDPR